MNIFTALATNDSEISDVLYPNYKPTSSPKIEIYLRTVLCLFWSCRISGYKDKLTLFVNNESQLNSVSAEIMARLSTLNVSIIQVPFLMFKPDSLLSKRFSLNFYKLEAMHYAANNMEDDIYVYLDSDCVMMKPLTCSENLSLYRVYDHKKTNEGSVKSLFLKNLWSKTGFQFNPNNTTFFGGEYISAKRDIFKNLIDECYNIFSFASRQNREAILFEDQTILDADEFLVSAAVNRMNILPEFVDDFSIIARTWTGRTHYIADNIGDYAIWHLPAEKQTGFLFLSECILKKHDFKPNVDLTDYLGNIFGVYGRKYGNFNLRLRDLTLRTARNYDKLKKITL